MKVSALLPLASAVLSATAFIVPDEQTIKNVRFEHHQQAPLSDEPSSSDRPHEHGEHGPELCSRLLRNHGHFGGLHPEYVLRRAYRHTDTNYDDSDVNYSMLEAFNSDAIEIYNEASENAFLEYYRPVGKRHFKASGPSDEWPKPPNWPPDKPWPPKKPEWPPPKPPGEKPEWPPRPPGGRPKHPRCRPHHPPHHKPNETIWELISKSNHTTKFAKEVSEFPEIVSILNGTLANYTLFVPTDRAFEKLKPPPGHKKPPKELIKKFITYHISNEFYPIFKILLGHTIPSSLDSDELGGSQRLKVGLTPHGLAVNFYSRVVAGNIFATNGVIHAVDSIIFLPPPALKLVSFFPAQFSTFELALSLTGLVGELPSEHTGGTLFAPTNDAFSKLGPKLNAFLFSPWGRKYLKALLQYHIVYNETLYSDAYYHPTAETGIRNIGKIPKGHYHVDLPTLLKGTHLSIDISRFASFISIVINGLASIHVQDAIAKDGVVQIPNVVLLPPKKPPVEDKSVVMTEEEEVEEMENLYGGMTVEAFKERFEGLVEDDETEGEYREEDLIAMWDI